MSTRIELIRRLRNPDNKVVLRAVEGLRAHGWLEEGALEGVEMRYAHLQRADLYKANLCKADLSLADLRWANLAGAELREAQLNSANLYRADLSQANLKGANLINTNLQGAFNLTDEQLAEANMLWGATLPGGGRYDGRFKLSGDLSAATARGIDLDDLVAMLDFYCEEEYIPSEVVANGKPKEKLAAFTDAQLVRRLRSSDRSQAASAVEELRSRGRLADGTLEWCHLKFVQLQSVNLNEANLHKADLSGADLQWSDLVGADLEGARLTNVNLEGAILTKASIKGALLVEANLFRTRGLTDGQLARASRLRGAKMPDGTRYDGRFNLAGDLWDASFLHINVSEVEALAEFYGVSATEYILGQRWTQEHMPALLLAASKIAARADVESVLSDLAKREAEMAVKVRR